jgi:REP element-mobilizing transposase RayT
MKLGPGLPSLRERASLAVVLDCFRGGCDRFGFRLVHFTVQHNHLHLICEADDEKALTAGMRGLAVRLSMNLNRHWGRRGQVFPERYHAVQLKSLLQIRNALLYVLMNHLRHRLEEPPGRIDSASSGQWFDGWAERELRAMCRAPEARDARCVDRSGHVDRLEHADVQCTPNGHSRTAAHSDLEVAPVVAPRSWQLRLGWKLHHPLISVDEVPKGSH